MDILDRLLAHDRWATSELLAFCGSLEDAALDREFDIGHRSLRSTFEHIISGVEVWAAIMAGNPTPPVVRGDPIATLTERHEHAQDALTGLATALSEEDRMDDTFQDFYGQPMTYGGAILNIILHSDEHRTEVSHILARLGMERIPEVDYGAWDFVRRGLWVDD